MALLGWPGLGRVLPMARCALTRQRIEQNRRVERWAATGSPQTGQVRPALASARWSALLDKVNFPVTVMAGKPPFIVPLA